MQNGSFRPPTHPPLKICATTVVYTDANGEQQFAHVDAEGNLLDASEGHLASIGETPAFVTGLFGVIGAQTVLLFPEAWGIDEDYEIAAAQALMQTIGENIGQTFNPSTTAGMVTDDGFSDFGSDLKTNLVNAVEGYAIAQLVGQLDLSALGDFAPIGSMAISGEKKKKRHTRSNRNPRLQKAA